MMEFRSPEAALDQRRIQAIAEAARPLLPGRRPRPPARTSGSARGRAPPTGCRSSAPRSRSRVFVAGGHGMWGITLARSPAGCSPSRSSGVGGDTLLESFDPLR